MEGNKIQNKPAMDQATKIKPSSGEKGSVRKKIGKAFSDMYGLVTKKKSKDRNASEKLLKPVPEYKKPAALLPISFHVQHINLKMINQVLVGILVGLFIVMVYVTFRQRPEVSSVMAAVSNIKIMDIEPKSIIMFKELPFYLDEMTKRNIFEAFQEAKAVVKAVAPEEPPPPPPPPKVTIEEKAKNFKLMGISWGDNPKAIIRDTTNQSMYFVDAGEKIKGTDLTVKEIFKDQVVISSEGDEMSMF